MFDKAGPGEHDDGKAGPYGMLHSNIAGGRTCSAHHESLVTVTFDMLYPHGYNPPEAGHGAYVAMARRRPVPVVLEHGSNRYGDHQHGGMILQ